MNENHRWSYSQLKTFTTCPRAFKLQYLDKVPQENNAFAEYGTLCHKIFEEWAKGDESYALNKFVERFNEEIKHPFPAGKVNLAESYFDKGYNYFEGFSGLNLDIAEILEVEKKFVIKIGKYDFVGVIDLIFRDKCGNIYILDHKSTGIQNIKPKKKFAEAVKQLYLYSKYVFDTYGEFPAELIFNVFNAGEILKEDFSHVTYNEVMDWAEKLMDEISETDEWPKMESSYWCWNVCSVLENCQEEE